MNAPTEIVGRKAKESFSSLPAGITGLIRTMGVVPQVPREAGHALIQCVLVASIAVNTQLELTP